MTRVDQMDRRHRETIALIVAAVSFVLLLAFLPILVMTGTDSVMIASALLMTLVIVWIVSLIAAIEYSESGWTVEGSTLEWMVAAMSAPFLALVLYLAGKEREEGDFIDPDDHERIRRL